MNEPGLRPTLALWIALLALVLGACSSTTTDTTHRRTGTEPLRSTVVASAASQIGAPYRYGGNRPDGFDCSGLVQFAHQRAGIAVPRTTTAQRRAAMPLERDHLLPGDLLFFAVDAGKSRHVGIYEGAGRFIHAPSAGKPVERASLENPYWKSRWIDSRTFI
jgi:cell wall-associated NlpC family hydrolase